MNGRILSILLTVAVLFSTPLPVTLALEALAESFGKGIAAYKAEDYETAVAAFERLAESGLKNGELFYNLGNAYLKSGDTGRAILWYERAMRLIPNDPDLRFNLRHARSLTKDEKADETPAFVKVLFFWNYLMTERAVRWTALAANLLFWGLLASHLWTKAAWTRNLAGITLAATLLFGGTAAYNYYADAAVRQGVVLAERLSVRSGLENATELFVLHAGTKVRVEAERSDHYKIRFSESKIGWVHRDDVGVI